MRKVKIGDVCTLKSGKSISKELELEYGKVPYVKVSDMSIKGNQRYITKSSRYVDIDSTSKQIFPTGTVIFPKRGGAIGTNKKRLTKCEICADLNIMGVIPNEEVVPEYLFEYFNSLDLGELSNGSSVPQLNNTDISPLIIPLPSKEIQYKVSQILNKAQQIIDSRKEQIEACDELIKSQFIEMFGSIKDNKYGYEIVRLGDYAKLQGGYAFKSKDFVEDGTKLVQISNVNKDTLDWETVNCLPEEYLDKYKGFSLKVGDIVLAMTRPVIKSLDAVKIAYVGEKDVPSLLNQRVGRFVVSNEYIDSAYLMECCRTRDFREYVERMSGNSLQPNVSSKQVEDYSILLPPLELQNQFAQFVQQVDKLKFEMQQSLLELENNFNSLMQRAFKGELF